MPFQSEKQRKYLWANEPEIARDWTDKYGSRVKKDTGGITRLPFFQGGYPNFFQMTPEKIAEARNLSWKDAWNLEKKYKYNPKYPGGVGKGKYTLEGLKSLMGMGDPKIGGASPLTRKLALMGSSPGMFNAFTSLGTTGLPLAYTYGASKLQESLPMSLIGQGGLSDQNPYFGAMGVSVDPTVEETLRYGDDGKPSPDTGEGSTLAKAWDAIKNEFGGSAQAADLSGMIPKNLEKTIEEGMQSYKKSNEISPALRKAIEEGTSYNEWDMIPNKKYHGIPMKRISLNQEEETYIDPHRIPGRIQKSVPRNMGILEKFRNRFYKPATRPAGGYGIAQLNRMNALGGQYSEPAREQRRQRSRVSNMLARQAAGKSYSQKNLNQLTMGSRPGHYDPPGGGGAAADTSPSTAGNNPWGR